MSKRDNTRKLSCGFALLGLGIWISLIRELYTTRASYSVILDKAILSQSLGQKGIADE